MKTLIALFLVLPNLVFWAIGQVWDIDLRWANVDYMLLASLALVIKRWLVAFLLTLLLCVDALVMIAPAFHFTPQVALLSLVDIQHWSNTSIIGLISIPIATALLFWLLLGVFKAFQADRLSTIAKAFLLGLMLVFAASLLPTTKQSDDLWPQYKIVNSRIADTLQLLAGGTDIFATTYVMEHNIPSATRPILEVIEAEQEAPQRIILIISEALGLANDPALTDLQWGDLLGTSIREKFHLETGAIAFKGSTVPSEMRELCQVRTGSYPRVASDVEHLHCIPEKLKALGYSTTAIHAFTGEMFTRNNWWHGLAFEQMLFEEDFEAQGISSKCGDRWRGVCDPELVKFLAQLDSQRALATPEAKSFTYFLTLNTHTPVDPVDDQQSDISCQHPALADHDRPICDMVRRHKSLHDQLAKVLLDMAEQSTLVVVVGDHAPPFLQRSHNAHFSSDQVPWLVLRSK